MVFLWYVCSYGEFPFLWENVVVVVIVVLDNC